MDLDEDWPYDHFSGDWGDSFGQLLSPAADLVLDDIESLAVPSDGNFNFDSLFPSRHLAAPLVPDDAPDDCNIDLDGLIDWGNYEAGTTLGPASPTLRRNSKSSSRSSSSSLPPRTNLDTEPLPEGIEDSSNSDKARLQRNKRKVAGAITSPSVPSRKRGRGAKTTGGRATRGAAKAKNGVTRQTRQDNPVLKGILGRRRGNPRRHALLLASGDSDHPINVGELDAVKPV
ncbi:hypothetical protein GGTG_13425 [Gaeumannomyces tritici R3-111a-1]|uniref:Uncharacterized protein n=1 Tax=Gaeumannomyces tritici (strain R3-111a-1) TaxID=644352 RepID=J3PIU5_GAET3|nr:hypothetical protein GGTG_13425 [Gaeumannomyces tritici R3-111a-1]EJT69028.1 hypothetical protein GGTG_13425 [Gaeumannomyces tritici R3-111a-1]